MRKIHKNCAILIPTFNDWQSLNKLIFKINNNSRKIAKNVSIYVVNDGSTKKSSTTSRKVFFFIKNLLKVLLI